MSKKTRLYARFFTVNPDVAPESGILAERFLFRLFKQTKINVIHWVAGCLGKLGENIQPKTG